jgi:hypothetical protein
LYEAIIYTRNAFLIRCRYCMTVSIPKNISTRIPFL